MEPPPPPFPPPLLKYYYGYKPKIGRKLRVLLSRDSPKWHTAIVKSFVTSKNEWKKPSIVLEFFDNDEDDDDDKKDGDVFSPGTYVEIQGLEKAHHHNGRCGIVLGQQQQIKQQKERRKKDSASSSSSSSSSLLLRYEVQISSNKDIDHNIILSIKPQNLIHKSLNDSNDGCVTGGGFQRSVYRIHPSIGGILIGKLKPKSSSSSTCSPDLVASSSEEEERISFEWIMGDDDDDDDDDEEEKMIIKDNKEEHNNMVVVENDDDNNKIIDDEDVCDYCGKSKEQLQVDKLKKCTRCNDAWYCRRECQSKDWSNHKSYCNDVVSELKSKSKKSSISSSFQKGDHILIHGLVIDKSLSSERNGLYGMIMDSVPKCNDNQYQVRIAVRSDNNHNNYNKNGTEREECELVAPDTEIIFVPKKNMKFVETNIPPPILPMPMNEVIELTVATLGLDDPIFLKKVREKRKIQLNSGFLEHTLVRLMTNGDPIALGKFLLEADMLYIILEFGQTLFDLLLGPSCTLDTKMMIFCVSRYCEKIGLNTKTISDMPKQLYLYESWTISLATTIARDILLNPSHEVWPQALEWIQVSVELSESSISRSDLSGNIPLAEMKTNIACNYWELIKTHVKVGNFGKSMELFQEKTDLLKNMSGLDADWRIIFAYLGEWTTGTSKQFLLEDQKQRFRHDTKMLQRYLFTNFRIIDNGTNATQNDLDRCYTNCPIHYPRFPFLLPVSQKILDRIQNKDVRDTYERMMDGDFTVDWKEKSESLHLHFSASSGPLRSEVVLSEMHIMPNLLLAAYAGITCPPGPPGTKFQEGLTVGINSEGSFKKFLAEEEQYKMAYRLTHIFLSRYASCLKIVDPKEVWQHFIEHYIEHKKWKDGYDAQIMLASLVMAENDTNSVTSKYVACIRAGESLEAMGKYQDAGSVYYEASKYFEPGPDFNKVNLVHNAGLAYKRKMQYELAEKYYVEALHYQSHVSKSADRWNYNHENCECIITSMIYNYQNWSAQDAGLDDDNKINRAFLPFVCLLYVSGFADKATGSKSHDEVIYYGPPISPVILKPRYRKKKFSKEALFKALDTKNVEDFRSFMKDITLPACESITIEGQAYNGGNKQQLKEAARNQLLENSTLENASTIVQNLCVQCKKILPNMLQCPCKTVSYCGKECQVKHWRNGHKKLCPLQ